MDKYWYVVLVENLYRGAYVHPVVGECAVSLSVPLLWTKCRKGGM